MAGANLVEFTTENWQKEVVDSSMPVLVDFWAPWCAPCRKLTPVVELLAEQFAGRAKVGKLNIDDNQEIAAQFRVSSIPQLLFFQGSNEPKQRLVGVQSQDTLVKELNRLLGV